MANTFYYNTLIYTPFQLDPASFCVSNINGGYIFLPLMPSSPPLLEFHPQTICTNVFTTTEPEETGKEPLQALHCQKSKKSVRSSNHRKQADYKQDDSEEFKVKEVKTGVGVTYKKKNTESNIVNQTFSYLSSQRSWETVKAFFKGDQQQAEEYYRLMTKVKQLNKKYINRKYLKKLIEFSYSSEFHRAFLKSKIKYLTLQKVQQLLRALTYYFLRENSVLTLLTSSKIYKQTLPEHFWRKREIIAFLFDKKGQQRNDRTVQ